MQRISNGNKMLLFCTFNNFQGNSNYFQGTDGFWDLINIKFYDLTCSTVFHYLKKTWIFGGKNCCTRIFTNMMFSILESDLAAINKKHQILTDLNAKLESKYKTLR